jgi:predicted transcriptional regulator
VKLAAREMGWKKSTTYTVLHKLTEKGVLQNESSVVTSLVGKGDVWKNESAAVVERAFEGSLPGFVAAFLGGILGLYVVVFIGFAIQYYRRKNRR